MPGLRQPLSAHIQQIRNDLRERYKGGFPILKELMQNADDAGAGVKGASASELVLLLAKGIPDSHHVLLQTPGLCLVNDGDFTAADAISISSYGSSNRGSQSAAVGRFGLGLKSVFHWAEAFFYFSSANFDESGDGCPPSDLLHPWISRETGQGFHKDWDQRWVESKEHDHAQFERIARTLIKSERWFGLWIPFRAKGLLNGVEPVLPEWPLGIDGQETSYETLFGANWERRVSEVLPLLRRLRRIRFCTQGAGGVDEGLALAVEEPSRRMSFLAGNGHEFQPGLASLDGKVSIRKGAVVAETASFAGIEKLPGTANAAQWQGHRFWPRPFVQTENGGEEPRAEKAAEHGAVAFVRQRATEGQVRIQLAVFLPLGEPETRSVKGGASYAIFLHGHFFVDSGRRDIERFDDMAADAAFETVESEEALRKLWNRTLTRDVVAPLVLPSLDLFVKQERMETGEVEALVEAMEKSKTLKPLTPWMCRGQRFILRLLRAGSAWERQTWNDEPSRWLELPAPDFPEVGLFNLIPALAPLSSQVMVSLEGKPYLADYRQKPTSPTDEELAGLLSSVPVSVFSDPQQLAYVLRLIPQNASERKLDSPLTTALTHLANNLISDPLPQDEALAKLWKHFFKQMAPAAFVGLPAKSTEASPEISQVFADSELSVALLWQDFHDARGSGSIIWPILLPVLQGIGGLELRAENEFNQRSRIAVRLLETSTGKPADWAGQIRQLALFAAREPDKTAYAASFGDLQVVKADGRLFSGQDSWPKDLTKAAPELRPVLVQLAVAEALNLQAPDCNAAACVKMLQNAERLATDFSSRKPLFERLLQVARQDDADFWAALRCLLHGDISAWEATATLFDETGAAPVPLRLLEKGLAVANQRWRRISASAVGQLGLTAQQRQHLNLVPASEAHVETLIREVEPAKLDCSDLSTGDCDFILERFNAIEVLRGLNIHETVDKRRVRICPHTYVDDGTFQELPIQFNALVTRLRDRPGYARFRNTDGFRTLNWEAVLEIGLAQQVPAQWWNVILTGIGNLGTLRVELRERVRNVSWLPRSVNSNCRPSQVLDLPGAEAELDRLPSEVLNDYLPLLRLAEPVRKHDRFSTFQHAVLLPANEALNTLANLLRPHPTWSTGLSDQWTSEQLADWVQTLGNAPRQELPIAALLKCLYAEPQIEKQLPGFLKPLGGRLLAHQYAAILKQLATGHEESDVERRPIFERVFLRYLETIGGAGMEFTHCVFSVDGVKLLSAAGTWQTPGKLTLVRNGVHPESVVSSKLEPALANLRTGRTVDRARQERLPFPWPGELPQRSAATVQLLRGYFEPWRDHLPTLDPIGFLLGVMGGGDGMVAAASQFLSVHTVEGIRDWVDQHEKPKRLSFSRRINTWTFLLERVERGDTLKVPSLLGTSFQAKSGKGLSSIFVGDENDAFQIFHLEPGKLICQGRLLDFNHDLETNSPEELLAVLEASMQTVLGFADADVDIGPLWETAKKATQLHVRVAQSMVLDGAIAFLQQVGAQRHQLIKQALALWHEAQRIEAEEEVQGFAGGRSEERRRKARRTLRDLLSSNPEVQGAMLKAVRDKIHDFGYASSSVPFELWQNADDAIAQLERLARDPTDAVVLGFVVVQSQADLRFCHWGRLVNEFQRAGGRNCRDDGFDRDMVNMLVPAISDKEDLARRGGPVVTGKFGLGFKSVFLVSDAPEILSGNVDFVARGGIYPDRLTDQQREDLRRELELLAPNNARRGTIIRLALRSDAQTKPDEVIGLFRNLGPLLVVFSRRLKRLRFRSQDEQVREMRWQPRTLAEGIEIGALEHFNGQANGALLFSQKIDSDRLQFLLGLDADGFVALPDEVPAFWVTAPTRTTPGYGFAVNGPFEPDVGRVQLALNSPRNEELAGEIARMLPNRLQALGQQAENDWEVLKQSLRLASGLSRHDFWQSLWDVLVRRFAERCSKSDTSTVAKLARRILWDSESDGLRCFYCNCHALPAGLWEDYHTLTRLPDLHFSAMGALDRKAVFQVVSGWPVFRKEVPVGLICSNTQVVSTLERLGVHLKAVEPVYLSSAVEWELGEGRRADPELATRLGLLITLEFLKNLREGKPGERNEQEHMALNELLGKAQLHAADGSWHKAAQLVVAAGEGVVQDEKLRAAFAPQECRLNPAYTGSALEFFLACRPRLEADVETMTTWVLQAKVEQIQVAALGYLLKGELKERLAEELRRQRDDSNWLWRLAEIAWFQTRFTADEQHQIRAYILRLFDDDLRQRTITLPIPPPQPEQEPVCVWTVAELWKWWHGLREPAGDYTLEGEANWDLFHGGSLWGEEARKAELKRLLLSPGGPDGKALWYRLFAYACLISAGRTVTELRDFWKYQLNPCQFWERTSAGDFSESTREIFEQAVTTSFTNMAAGGEQAYFWRRVFYDVRKVHRMVQNEFPAVLLDLVNQGHGGHLRQFLRTGNLPGPDQRPWIGTFGQSADTPLGFIIRELVRLEVITDEAVRPYAFYVCRPVLRALTKIGWIADVDSGFSGESWLTMLQTDPENGMKLMPYYDIPLLHLGITHRGDKMPRRPE